MTHPKALKKLSEEVRSTFTNSSEIDITSVQKLSYLLAVFNESLRLYPPVTNSVGLVRMVPPEGEYIAGDYVSGGVSNFPYVTSHIKSTSY